MLPEKRLVRAVAEVRLHDDVAAHEANGREKTTADIREFKIRYR